MTAVRRMSAPITRRVRLGVDRSLGTIKVLATGKSKFVAAAAAAGLIAGCGGAVDQTPDPAQVPRPTTFNTGSPSSTPTVRSEVPEIFCSAIGVSSKAPSVEDRVLLYADRYRLQIESDAKCLNLSPNYMKEVISRHGTEKLKKVFDVWYQPKSSLDIRSIEASDVEATEGSMKLESGLSADEEKLRHRIVIVLKALEAYARFLELKDLGLTDISAVTDKLSLKMSEIPKFLAAAIWAAGRIPEDDVNRAQSAGMMLALYIDGKVARLDKEVVSIEDVVAIRDVITERLVTNVFPELSNSPLARERKFNILLIVDGLVNGFGAASASVE